MRIAPMERFVRRTFGVVLFVLWFGVALMGIAGAQQTGYTAATVDIPPVIEVLSWPHPEVQLSGPYLNSEWLSNPLLLVLRANAPWRIEVQTDSDTGVLREFDTVQGVYVEGGRTTVNAAYLQLIDSDEPIALGSTPTVLAASDAPTGGAGHRIQFYLAFRPTFDDVPLPEGRTYRVQLTYTVGMGF